MKKLLIKFNFQDSYICTYKTKHETTRIHQTGLKNTNTEIKKNQKHKIQLKILRKKKKKEADS